MKKVSLLAFGLFIFFMSCEKDPNNFELLADRIESPLIVKQENKSVIINLCGIHCPPCGGWGWTASDELADTSAGDALPMVIYGDNNYNRGPNVLLSQTATQIEQYLPLTGWPTFAANQEIKYARSSGVNVKEEKRMMLEAVSSQKTSPVIAGAAVEYWLADSALKFRYKMELFNPSNTGHYRLAVYLIEDEVPEYQAGHPDPQNALHPVVLREGYQGAWGIPFKSNSGNSQTMSGTGSIDLKADWDRDKFSVYAIVYQAYDLRNPSKNKIDFVNAAEGELRN